MQRLWTAAPGQQDAVIAPAAVVAPVAVVAPRRTINPIFPILCIGLILFLVAATIVIALIPVYLQVRDIQRGNQPSAQFTTRILLRNGFLPVGPLSAANCGRIQTLIRQRAAANSNVRPSVPSVTSCTVLGNSTITGRRMKRQAQSAGNLIEIVVILSPADCFSNACIIRRALALIADLLNAGDLVLSLFLPDGSLFDFIIAFISASDVTLVPSTPGTGTTTTSAPGASTTNAPGASTTSTPTSNALNTIFLGVTNASQLLAYNASNPSVVIGSVNITGLNAGDIISNIDYRPATGQLYGTANRQLYIINEATGVARPIGPNLDPGVPGNIVSMEFDPVFDVIRYITDRGLNLPIDPEEGVLFISPSRPVTSDTDITVAYSNNLAGAATTSLFSINPTTDVLNRLDQRVNATVTQVGSGLGVNITDTVGFDISSLGVPLACVVVGNSLVVYVVDLNSGAFSQRLGVVNEPIVSLAIPTVIVTYTVLSNNNSLIYSNLINSAFQLSSKTITGLQPNESFVSIDMRPFNGQLYGVTSASRLYLFNMGTAEIYPTNNGTPFSPPIRGTNFAIDFNPQVDRIRVVTDQGQNFVLNPITGLVQSTNTNINPGNITVTSIAYSNNVANATNTTLYDISSALSRLYIQNTPNNGTLFLVGPLNITLQAGNGFDIGSASNEAVGLFTVNGVTSYYDVNLANGIATKLFDNVVSPTAVSFALSLNA